MAEIPKHFIDPEIEVRKIINAKAGRCHELSREILNRDWYDTESQARSVICWIVDKEEKKNG